MEKMARWNEMKIDEMTVADFWLPFKMSLMRSLQTAKSLRYNVVR